MVTIFNTKNNRYYTAAVSSFQNHFIIRYDLAGLYESGKFTHVAPLAVSGEPGVAETH
jgi:hypothetical protein